MTLKPFYSFIIIIELPISLISLIFGPACFLTSDCFILLILKFSLDLPLLDFYYNSVLTVIVFLSDDFFSVSDFTSVFIGLTALFSLDPNNPNLFFLTVGELSA